MCHHHRCLIQTPPVTASPWTLPEACGRSLFWRTKSTHCGLASASCGQWRLPHCAAGAKGSVGSSAATPSVDRGWAEKDKRSEPRSTVTKSKPPMRTEASRGAGRPRQTRAQLEQRLHSEFLVAATGLSIHVRSHRDGRHGYQPMKIRRQHSTVRGASSRTGLVGSFPPRASILNCCGWPRYTTTAAPMAHNSCINSKNGSSTSSSEPPSLNKRAASDTSTTSSSSSTMGSFPTCTGCG